MLNAADLAIGPTQEVVIAGEHTSPQTVAMVRLLHSRFLPRTVVVLHPPGTSGQAIETLVPYVKAQQPVNGLPTAYVCEHFVCKLPTTDLTRFEQQLNTGGAQ